MTNSHPAPTAPTAPTAPPEADNGDLESGATMRFSAVALKREMAGRLRPARRGQRELPGADGRRRDGGCRERGRRGWGVRHGTRANARPGRM